MKEKTKIKINQKLARNNIKNNEKAITLVALVVTIIVLIILAGVSINLVLGNNGIITKARNARSNFQRAEEEEGTGLNAIYAEMNEKISGTSNYGGQVGGNTIIAGQTATNENKEYSDGTDTAIIPKGFTVSGISTEQTIANGLVIYDLEGNTVENWNADTNSNSIPDVQENYNQYVWVPVTGSLARYEGYFRGSLDSMLAFCSEPLNYNSTTAASWETTEYTAMKNSVDSNHGFYIARYEASKGNNGTKDIAESKREKAVWNSIAWGTSMTSAGTTGAVYNAQQVYNNNSNYNVTSTLIYGSEWDSVLVWIDSSYKTGTCESTSFIVNSIGHGNYSNTKSTYGNPGSTGIFDVKNIYDIAGNVSEWTMEAYNTNARVYRGGHYDSTGSNIPVSGRATYTFPTPTSTSIGFRVALYICSSES